MNYYYPKGNNSVDLDMVQHGYEAPFIVESVSTEVEPKRRPGPLPARRDEELDQVELEKRERRREHNRQAAARCRNRQVQKLGHLEGQLIQLTESKTRLQQANEAMRMEVERIKYRQALQYQRPDNCWKMEMNQF